MFFLILSSNLFFQTYLQSVAIRLEEMRVKKRDAEQWMHHRSLPPEIRERVRRYERYRWLETRGVDEENLVQTLPKDLRRDIKRHLCLGLVKRVGYVWSRIFEILLVSYADSPLFCCWIGTFVWEYGWKTTRCNMRAIKTCTLHWTRVHFEGRWSIKLRSESSKKPANSTERAYLRRMKSDGKLRAQYRTLEGEREFWRNYR